MDTPPPPPPGAQFDDEELIPRKEDEIQTLAGGGDWHMAYLLLYRAVRVPDKAQVDAEVEAAALAATLPKAKK